MSNERKPMLSDEEIIDETWVPDMSSWAPAGAYEAGMHWTRRYYEDLITTGKLRVVEETEYVPPDTWCSVCICVACGEACGETGEKEPYPYCPYCRRKIKLTKQ